MVHYPNLIIRKALKHESIMVIYLSELPIQTDNYISELLEIFLKLLMKTVQVHLIIEMRLE